MAQPAANQTPTPDNPPPEPPVAADAKAAAKAEAKAKAKGEASDAGRAWPDQATADAGRLAKPLPENRWSLLEHKDPGHWVCLERGTPYEAVFEPSFWASVAARARLQPGQTIHLTNDELSVFAVLKVLDCGRNWAVVGEFHKRTIDELVKSRPPMKEQPRHRVEFSGPIDKWRIIRADNQVIKAGFETEQAAQAYLAEYMKRLGA